MLVGGIFVGISGEGSCVGGVTNISVSGAASDWCLGGVVGGKGVLFEGLFTGFCLSSDGDSGVIGSLEPCVWWVISNFTISSSVLGQLAERTLGRTDIWARTFGERTFGRNVNARYAPRSLHSLDSELLDPSTVTHSAL